MQIGSSPVLVGILTSDALVWSIASAMSVLCPLQQTRCNEKAQLPIKGIVYIEEDSKSDDGELLVQIDSASFQQSGNDDAVRNALIGLAAHSFAAAASGSNCAKQNYIVEETRRRNWIEDGKSPHVPRERPYPQEESIVLCKTGHFARPQYYAQVCGKQEKPGPQDYIGVEINFKVGADGELICDFIGDSQEFVETVFTSDLLSEERLANEEIGNVSIRLKMHAIGLTGTPDIACRAVSLAGWKNTSPFYGCHDQRSICRWR